MPLQKQNININFAQGLDTKTDPFQVQVGKMLALQNSVFQVQGRLQKRNGFKDLPDLIASNNTFLTTYKDNLLAIGSEMQLLTNSDTEWVSKGSIQSLDVSTTPIIRTSTSQTAADIATNSDGLACAVFLDSSGNSYYQVFDSVTGQIVVNQTLVPNSGTQVRVFTLGGYFIVTYLATSGGTSLKYIYIPFSAPDNPSSPVTLSSQVSGASAAYDGIVANNNLYLAFDASDLGGAVRVLYIDSSLVPHTPAILAGSVANLMSVVADTSGSTPVIWISFYTSGSTTVYSAAFGPSLTAVLAPTSAVTGVTINELTSFAVNAVNTIFYQNTNTYAYSSIRSDYTSKVTMTQGGVAGTPSVVLRSVGIASKAFYISDNAKIYLMVAYASTLQPTYFISDSDGNIVAKLAYSNGGGYQVNQILPQANVIGNTVQIAYLFKDLLATVNKDINSGQSSIYSQTGVNFATFTFNTTDQVAAEIGNDLHLTGGFLWMFDSVKPVEHGFHLYPEDIGVTTATGSGGLTAQQYYYQVTYEWTDAQGNLHRSAPSIPTGIVTTTSSSTNTIKIPTLRVTYKTSPNPVRIVIYRWSQAQQSFYQITSITSPTLNDPSVDYITYTDTQADSAILGNVLLYTTGGVVENIAAPSCSAAALFKSRLFLIDAEDPNLLWYSKQVIESTPVEMSDLFTQYVAPTTAAQGPTGPMHCLSALDDKLIIFKKNAIYYMTGNGPDNTGANNDFSEPTFISAVVGCTNQRSIVFMPQGLMFQSDKGIWLLGRDLSTSYIGAPVEAYNNDAVLSAINIPGTNQVRFTLASGVTLMYDYYYNQWGTFTNIPATSSAVYNSLHTYLNASAGMVRQENPGSFLDGSKPVLMSLTTGWLNLSGLQGYQRAYFLYLLGTYKTPHKLTVKIAYDYDSNATQSTVITPDNFSPAYGDDTVYGGGNPYGGTNNVENWRIFLQQQRCQAIQITITESYDASQGAAAGAGLYLSGINFVYGTKKGYRPIRSTHSAG